MKEAQLLQIARKEAQSFHQAHKITWPIHVGCAYSKTLTAKLKTSKSKQRNVVMVTGASSGLGRGFCLDLAKAGCRIIAAARQINLLQSLCDEINTTNGARALPVELDVSASGPSIEASVRKAWDAFGRIDALINNAGVRGTMHTPLDLTEEEWSNVVRVNTTGNWLVSKFVCIRMRDSRLAGSIINVSSIAGLDRGQFLGSFAYTASKTAVNAMTKIMALELGVHKIRVNLMWIEKNQRSYLTL